MKRAEYSMCHAGYKIKHQDMITCLQHCIQLARKQPQLVYVMYDCDICGFGHVGRAPKEKLLFIPLTEDLESEII